MVRNLWPKKCNPYRGVTQVSVLILRFERDASSVLCGQTLRDRETPHRVPGTYVRVRQSGLMQSEKHRVARSYRTELGREDANIMAGLDFRDGFCESEPEILTIAFDSISMTNLLTGARFFFFRELLRRAIGNRTYGIHNNLYI